jgi:hypothetical protein
MEPGGQGKKVMARGGPAKGWELVIPNMGAVVWTATNALLAASVPQASIHFCDGLETLTNGIAYGLSLHGPRQLHAMVLEYRFWGY